MLRQEIYLNDTIKVIVEINETDRLICVLSNDDKVIDYGNLNVYAKTSDSGIAGTIGGTGLSAASLLKVKDIVDAVQAEFDKTQAGALIKLIAQREKLKEEINIFMSMAHDEHTNNIEHLSANGTQINDDGLQSRQKADQLKKELSELENENPDLTQYLKSKKDESFNDFLSSN